jgi:hypothetical protein
MAFLIAFELTLLQPPEAYQPRMADVEQARQYSQIDISCKLRYENLEE